jgi:hypothetical protein
MRVRSSIFTFRVHIILFITFIYLYFVAFYIENLMDHLRETIFLYTSIAMYKESE